MRILAILAASYTAAVLCGVYGGLERPLPYLCGAFLLAAIVFFSLRKHLGRRGIVLALCFLGLAAGFGWTAAYEHFFVLPARMLDDQTIRLTGQVLQYPEQTRWGYSVLVEADLPEGGSADALLYVDRQGAGLLPGDKICTVAHLTFADKTYSGEEITYYTAKGVLLRGECYGQLQISRPERLPVRFVPTVLSRRLEENILDAFSAESEAQVLAVVTGNRDRLTQSFTTSLQRTGLSHVAAVSGMHLAFLAGGLSWILGRNRRRTSVTVIPLVLLFMLVAGCTPSIVRAAVMIILLHLAPMFGRERDDFTALGAALLVLLIHNPLAVTHVGLQLSFAAVAGIFLVAEPIGGWLEECLPGAGSGKSRGQKILFPVRSYLISTLSAAFGAMVFTVPLTAIHFSSVSLLAPVSNLLTLWAVAAVFCGGVITGTLGFFSGWAAGLCAGVTAPFALYLDKMTGRLSRFTYAAVTTDSVYYQLWTAIFCIGVSLLLAFGKGKKRLILPGCLAVITLCCAMMLTAYEFERDPVNITMLDVGQGQCILLRQGDFLTVVDCGGSSYDDAGDLAANYLQNAGCSRIDLLVLTHFHDDHANGVPQLLRRLDVEMLAVPETEEESALRDEILHLAAEQGTQCWTVEDDTRIDLRGGHSIQLFPPLGARSINERGLGVLAKTGEWEMLMTGDMNWESERLLMEHTELPQTEVLVAGHHGGADSASQALLTQINPEIVLISVGENNVYGHPAQETLERLSGREIYRTDRDGTVQIRVSEGEVFPAANP